MSARNNSLKRASAASIQGIINSCCPFITAANKESAGSPPYSKDIRLRIHNWSNSLSGASEIPRDVHASDKEKPGLPVFSRENSAVTFEKSDTSLHKVESEDDFTVLLEARRSPISYNSTQLSEDPADPTQLENDWQTERGVEEEVLVALTVKKKQSDGEVGALRLEAKEASIALLEKRQQHSPVAFSPPKDLELPSSQPASRYPSAIAEFKEDKMVIFNEEPEPERQTSSLEMFDAVSQQPLYTTRENSGHSSSTELLETPVQAKAEELLENVKVEPEENIQDQTTSHTHDAEVAQPGESSQASDSSELLSAICKLRPSRGGKCRRSRMTSTRAPTPWSEAQPEDAIEDDFQLERASPSTGASSYSSVEALADSSSFHTLSTASASAEAAINGAADGAVAPEADPAMAEAAGDRPPPQADDGFNLRYFCGAFRPDDHEMSLTAGLEEVSVAELLEARRPQVPPFHSDSVVGRPVEVRPQRGSRGASLSDMVLPLSSRPSAAEVAPPSADSSGVTLEAKPPSTCLSPESALPDASVP